MLKLKYRWNEGGEKNRRRERGERGEGGERAKKIQSIKVLVCLKIRARLLFFNVLISPMKTTNVNPPKFPALQILIFCEILACSNSL